MDIDKKSRFSLLKEKCNILFCLRVLSFSSVILFLLAVYTNIQSSLWRDEAFSALTIKMNLSGILHIARLDTNPPLFHLLVHYIVLLLGENEITLRLLSVISIVIATLVLRLLIQDKVLKELTTILFLTNANVYLQATEARYYAVFICLAIITFYFTNELLTKFTYRNLCMYTLCSILLLYSDSLAVLAYGANTLILVYFLFTDKTKRTIVMWIKFIAVNAIILLCFSPWVYQLLFQFNSLKESQFWLTFDPIFSPIQAFAALIVNINGGLSLTPYQILPCIVAAFVFLFFIWGSVTAWKTGQRKYIFYFVFIFVSFYVISFKQPILYVRYIFFVLPVFLYVIALGIGNIEKVLNKIWKRSANYGNLIIVGIALGIFLFNTVIYASNYIAQTKQPFAPLAAYLDAHGYGNYPVVTNDEYLYYPCEYYFKHCYLMMPYAAINKSIGMSLISNGNLVTEKQVQAYGKVIWIYDSESEAERAAIFMGDISIDAKTFTIPINSVTGVVYVRK